MLIQLRTASKTVLLQVTRRVRERNCATISRDKFATSPSEPIEHRTEIFQQLHAVPKDFSDKTLVCGMRSPLQGDREMCSRAQSSLSRLARSEAGHLVALWRVRGSQLLRRAIQSCCKYAVVAKWSPRGQALVMFVGYSITRWRLSEPWPESEMPLVRPGDPLSGSLFCPKS